MSIRSNEQPRWVVRETWTKATDICDCHGKSMRKAMPALAVAYLQRMPKKGCAPATAHERWPNRGVGYSDWGFKHAFRAIGRNHGCAHRCSIRGSIRCRQALREGAVRAPILCGNRACISLELISPPSDDGPHELLFKSGASRSSSPAMPTSVNSAIGGQLLRGLNEVMAQTLSINLDDIERIDRMTALSQARRDPILREIEGHRETLSVNLRRAAASRGWSVTSHRKHLS